MGGLRIALFVMQENSMPTYSMKNTETEEVYDIVLKMSDREPYLAANPHIVQVFTVAPAIGDSARMGFRKPDMGFRDVLKKAQVHKHNTINTF